MERIEGEHWALLQEHDCMQAKGYLFEKYKDWAEFEGKQWFNRLNLNGIPLEDYISLAYEATLESMSSFDHTKGYKFQSFAKKRIKGNILNRIFKYSEYSSYLNKSDTFSPEFIEFSEEEFEEVVVALAAQYFLSKEHTSTSLSGDYYSSPEMDALTQKCLEKIAVLQDPLDEILKLHYEFQLPLNEIANLLGLTKGRISQLHKKAILQLAVEL